MLKTRVLTKCAPKTTRDLILVVSQQQISSDVESNVSTIEIDTEAQTAESESLVEILNWGKLANCKGKMRLFFAPKAERPQARHRREAKAHSLCMVCPVQTQCFEFARHHHEYGYWGGESEEERHRAGFTIAAPIGIRARNQLVH